MIHEVLPVGPLQCNCSILGDETTREAIIVDPGDNIPELLVILARHSLSLKKIVVTHAHIDHIAGAQQLKRITGAPVLLNQHDLPLVAMMDVQAGWLGVPLPEVATPDDDLPHGRTVSVSGIDGTILHTPGHSPGSVCLYVREQRLLLAGDTLFAGTVGRTDLPGGNARTLLVSIREHLLPLPDDTRVIPGHGRQTTIGSERERNPFLNT